MTSSVRVEVTARRILATRGSKRMWGPGSEKRGARLDLGAWNGFCISSRVPSWPSVRVKTQGLVPKGSKAGLYLRPLGPPSPNVGGRRPHTSRALESENSLLQSSLEEGPGRDGCWPLDAWRSDPIALSDLWPVFHCLR